MRNKNEVIVDKYDNKFVGAGLASARGITLIALVITIVVLIILAGVAINLSLGENGIFSKAQEAKQKQSESSAREKLELILVDAKIEKETNTSYNREDFLTEMLEENNITVDGDSVIVDNYNFVIDREKLEILESLGETQIKVTAEVQEYLGKNENDKYMVSLLLVVESNTGLQSVVIQNPDGTTFEMTTEQVKLGKDMEVEFDEEYILTVTTKDGTTQTRKIVEKSVENIRTAEELAAFRDKVNTGLTYEGKTINVVKDIDLSSVCGENINGEEISWEPISKTEAGKTNYFKGTFDGNYHTIDNLYINTSNDNQGLFGYIDNSIIKRIIIGDNSCMKGVGNTWGMIVGSSKESTVLECGNMGNIIGNGWCIAGIVGSSEEWSIVEKCYNEGNIFNALCYAAGICGNTRYNATIDSCYNTGMILSAGNNGYGASMTGGIAGGNDGISTVKNCYNIGDVTASYPYVGGIIGYNGNGQLGTQTVYNVFNTGTIKYGTTTPSQNIGTAVGYLIGRYGTLTGKYGNTTKDAMKTWDEAKILENLGANFKINKDEKVNEGLPILDWQ